MREVAVADALEWLPAQRGRGPVVASPPDAGEMGLGHDEWLVWFRGALRACFDAADGAPVVLCVTDRRVAGQWVSKAMLVMCAAGDVPLRWHKLALRRAPGVTDIKRPGYMHVLAYGGDRPGPVFADVWEPGPALWPNGTPVRVAYDVVRWIDGVWCPRGTIVNPFCGVGTFLAAAERVGWDAAGCELDAGRAELSRTAQLEHVNGGRLGVGATRQTTLFKAAQFKED
jgi:hypothetical protein